MDTHCFCLALVLWWSVAISNQTENGSSSNHNLTSNSIVEQPQGNLFVTNKNESTWRNTNATVLNENNTKDPPATEKPPKVICFPNFDLNQNSDSLPNVDVPQFINPSPANNPANNFLQYIRPLILRPLSEKISKITNLITTPNYHPNDGIINYLNPSFLWQRLTQKGQQFFANPNSAINGIGQVGGHDYPFPYRTS